MRNNKGFTLIELLTVIAIIGILASVILVGLGGFRARGRDSRRIADLRQVQNALELYYLKNGCYPGNIGTWDDLNTEVKAAGIGVDKLPNDPQTGNTYDYFADTANPACARAYVLRAQLEGDNPALRDSLDDADIADLQQQGVTISVGAGGCNKADPDYYYCVKF